MALPSGMRAIVEKSHMRKPFLWLVRMQIQTAADQPPLVFPITSYTQEVRWPPPGTDAAGPGDIYVETFYPYPFKFQNLKESSEGQLPQVDIAFDNSTRLLMDMGYQCGGFEGAEVVLTLLHEETIGVDTEYVRWDFEALPGKADANVMTLRLGTRNLFQVKVPSDRYVANRCKSIPFGGKRCGYVINEVAAFTKCDFTLTACKARGDDEVARGLPRLHPERFGGFIGISVQRQQ